MLKTVAAAAALWNKVGLHCSFALDLHNCNRESFIIMIGHFGLMKSSFSQIGVAKLTRKYQMIVCLPNVNLWIMWRNGALLTCITFPYSLQETWRRFHLL
jgi:hypothetical protein